jgi:hypothetical protein
VGGQHGPRQRPFLQARLRDSREHRKEVETARAWGISRRRFLGWEPRQVTTYSYDDAGRLVSSVTETEPEWNDDDRAWAYALADVEAEMCPGGCGQPLAESTAVGADDDYFPHRLQCHACAQKRRVEQESNPGDLVWVVRHARDREEG